MKLNLLDYKKNVFSQNGEDGIIEKIFDLIKPVQKVCCEFGAWDGIHFSNTRNLILNGWTGIMIEGDDARYKELVSTYKGFDRVYCINKFVDDKENSLSNLFRQIGIEQLFQELDLLSIDIDGFDYDIFKGLDASPKVICIEINAGHGPINSTKINTEIAQNNIGQPMHLFSKVAKEKGYSLCCYNGNAFYVREDIVKQYNLPTLSDEEAYINFLAGLSQEEMEWLYAVNLGMVPPFYRFNNSYLDRGNLGVDFFRSLQLKWRYRKNKGKTYLDQ